MGFFFPIRAQQTVCYKFMRFPYKASVHEVGFDSTKI